MNTIILWLIFIVIAAMPIIFSRLVLLRFVCTGFLLIWGLSGSECGPGASARIACEQQNNLHKDEDTFAAGARQTALYERRSNFGFFLPTLLGLAALALFPRKQSTNTKGDI